MSCMQKTSETLTDLTITTGFFIHQDDHGQRKLPTLPFSNNLSTLN